MESLDRCAWGGSRRTPGPLGESNAPIRSPSTAVGSRGVTECENWGVTGCGAVSSAPALGAGGHRGGTGHPDRSGATSSNHSAKYVAIRADQFAFLQLFHDHFTFATRDHRTDFSDLVELRQMIPVHDLDRKNTSTVTTVCELTSYRVVVVAHRLPFEAHRAKPNCSIRHAVSGDAADYVIASHS